MFASSGSGPGDITCRGGKGQACQLQGSHTVVAACTDMSDFVAQHPWQHHGATHPVSICLINQLHPQRAGPLSDHAVQVCGACPGKQQQCSFASERSLQEFSRLTLNRSVLDSARRQSEPFPHLKGTLPSWGRRTCQPTWHLGATTATAAYSESAPVGWGNSSTPKMSSGLESHTAISM